MSEDSKVVVIGDSWSTWPRDADPFERASSPDAAPARVSIFPRDGRWGWEVLVGGSAVKSGDEETFQGASAAAHEAANQRECGLPGLQGLAGEAGR